MRFSSKSKLFLSLVLILVLAIGLFALSACGQKPADNPTGDPDATLPPMHIGGIMGPAGMGLAKMIEDDSLLADSTNTYTIYSAPDDAMAAFVNGDLDIAAVPINVAGALYNKLDKDVMVIAVNTLGVLYILENGDTIQSIDDLAGAKLAAMGQAATPEYILRHILAANGIEDQVEIEFSAQPAEISAQMAAGNLDLGMLAEPSITATMMKNADLRIALNLTEEWAKISDQGLIQGVFIARRSFAEANPEAIADFLAKHKESTAYVNANPAEASLLIEKHGILAAAPAAEKAIPNSNIVSISGDDMKAKVSAMLQVLFDANPSSIGGAMPGDDLYYI